MENLRGRVQRSVPVAVRHFHRKRSTLSERQIRDGAVQDKVNLVRFTVGFSILSCMK